MSKLSYASTRPEIPALKSTLRERVHHRTQELAVFAGRIPPEIAQSDYEQAKRELTGETDRECQSIAWR
ncbi:MAG: hypothetical protein J6386_22370 [Candidatus Synoicihabitans palmerolidicus]|nr:hypothetical protein [Candidatus Synoicihabitans palmerolidicus]